MAVEWLGLIGPALGLAQEILKLINTNNARKYVDKMYEIKKDIQEEQDKGYHSDDLKIEKLYSEFTITMEAFKNEVALNINKS